MLLCVPARVKYSCELPMLLTFPEYFTVCGSRPTLPEQSVLTSALSLCWFSLVRLERSLQIVSCTPDGYTSQERNHVLFVITKENLVLLYHVRASWTFVYTCYSASPAYMILTLTFPIL